jgi:YD repeat-containing protein
MRFINRKIGSICLCTTLWMSAGFSAKATTDPIVTKPIQGSMGQFVVGAESYAKDMKYFSLSAANRNAIQNNSILNMVGIGIEEQSNYYIRSNFSVTVTLQITTYDKNEVQTGSYPKSFTVTYDTTTGTKYKSLDYTTYSNAYALRAKITSIDSGNINWPVSKVLKVENQLTATRDYPFTCTLALQGLSTTLSIANNELTTSWTSPALDDNAGVTEYDLEWAWIDEAALINYKNGANYVQDLVFTNNATRVSITGSSYPIPLLYDDIGRIFVRVRPVQLRTDGQRIEGKWNWILNDANQPTESSNPVAYLFYGHEDKLNWQASTSFAEEGKRKTVIQYFDGSLRNRQTVTKDNTSNTTVVAESFYDYQGRAILQVLPAPTLNTAIAYAKNFNQAIGFTEYPKSEYDKLVGSASVCGNPAKPFNTDFGTANYYSAKNPLANIAENKYIPDATAGNPNEAYAFTETRLSPDGRIAAQGGVGSTHQLGSGHETKYYYESPAQEELDALFGTDAGEASHYSKNLVRDANGQFSVSYVDMHGRTIATALAGEAPKNADGSLMLDTLESKNEQLFTKQLIDRETNVVMGNSITSSKPFVVLKDNSTYAFDYALTPKQLNLISCSTNQPICYDCLYTLKFTISSDCDKQLVYEDSMANFTLGQYIQQCNANGNSSQGFTKHFEKVLNIGSYTVTKTLTLSSEAQTAYRNKYLQTDTCKKLIEFYNQELAVLQATSNCAMTCVSCKAAIGNDLNGFIQKFATEMNVTVASLSPETITQLTASFNEALANCDRMCNNNDGLDVLRSTREMMVQDMTPPYGQYAKLNDNSQTPPILNENKPFNIFKIGDATNPQSGYGINGTQPDYKQPRQLASDDITLISSGSYFNEFLQAENPSPTSLTSTDFASAFKTPWANQLLVHHPEYKKLQLSENQLKAAYAFEAKLEKDTTWWQASGIIPPLPDITTHPNQSYITSLIEYDPFFNGVGAAYKQRMINGRYLGQGQPSPSVNQDIDPVVHGIINYVLPHTQAPCPNAPRYDDEMVSMWQVAIGSVFCRDKADGDPCSLIHTNLTTKAGCTMNPAYAQPQNNFSEGCTTDRDWAWKIFKTLYLAERRKLIAAYLNDNNTITTFTPGSNGVPNYQKRFINYANPKSVFENVGIADAGNIGDIINEAGTNMNTGTGHAHELEQQQYDTVCRGYANVWISQLRACPQVNTILNNTATWVADSTWLITRLVAICRNGSDNTHYLGSSSVKTGNVVIVNGSSYTDFTQVVQEFLQTKAIPNPNAQCYNWLINTPKPYDKQKPLGNSYVLTKPSVCECERISTLRFEWQNSGFAGTFSAYLQYQHGTFISNEQLDALTALCTGNYQCKMLEKPIALPPALQCPAAYPNVATKTCISCADYAAIKAEFMALTSQPAPFIHPQNATEVSYNYAFANYANHKTGFSKTWMEYVAFQNTCTANNPTISCGSLDSTLNAFYLTPEYIANPSGLPCVQAFLNYFNSHYNVVYTYAQWMALFAQCGNTPNVCKPRLDCARFETLIDGFYNQNGVQVFRNNNCQSLFVNYVNTQLGSNYTFAQLQAIYNYTCGGSACGGLNICDFPNRFLLTRVYNAFKVAHPQPWNLPNCQQAFVDFFNTYFALVPAWGFQTIIDLYPDVTKDKCVPAISDLCNPPYTCNDLQALLRRFIALYGPVEQLPNCQQAFTDFFNQSMGTNYTYLQIAALYQSVCGSPLTVCQTATDCKTIIVFAENHPIQAINETLCHQQFLQLFNAYFGTSYATWEELYKLYAACGYDLNAVCKGCTLVADCVPLTAFVQDFKTSYPDPATQLGSNCQDYFAAMFNEQFGTKYTFAQIATYYLQQCNTVLDVCTSPCTKVTDFVTSFTTQYSSLKLPAAAKEDLFAFAYNNAFLKGADETAAVVLEEKTDNTLQPSTDDALKDSKAFDPLVNYPNIYNQLTNCGLTGFNLNPTSTITVYDPQVLLSLKQVYYILHPNGLPDDCQNDFRSWFNVVMKTQYEYRQLLALYNSVCGNNAGYICEPQASAAKAASVYVDFMGSTPTTINLPPMLCGLNEGGGTPVVFDDNPCKDLPKIAYHFAIEKYELYVDSLRNVFDAAYRKKCMAAKDLESFTITYRNSEYHYTLYYYDQSGQLVKTVPPAGVQKLSGTDIQIVKTYRANVLNGQPEATNQKTPPHTLATQYRYNTLGQVVAQVTPDAGLSTFFYDRLGRLVVSQNAKQAANNNYSYTLQDELGRIKEVGQLTNTTPITQAISQNGANANTTASLAWWLNNKPAEQITRTFYDKSYLDGNATLCPLYLCQTNLRNRVSYTAVYNTGIVAGVSEHQQATYYSYDIHGNVYELLQDYNSGYMKYKNPTLPPGTTVGKLDHTDNASGNRFKKIAYNYDLISGKVNSVGFQPNAPDAFYHRYTYDAENRLTQVETSKDKIYWEKDARYNYYKHGALARTLLGELQVQGIDYGYTLQGALKGINSTAVADGSFDMGQDGKIGGINSLVARDVYGINLNYFNTDYKAISTSVTPFATISKGNDLFNGNIKNTTVNIPKLGDAVTYGYTYDQLNRLKNVDAYNGLNNTTNTFTPISISAYKEQLTYDANGNIKTYVKNGENGAVKSNYSYIYTTGTNRLASITNSVNAQIKTYGYDNIGNTTTDGMQGMTNAVWNLYGKLQSCTNAQGQTITYTYDVSGQRISKKVGAIEEWYVKDASGNEMATYKMTDSLRQTEVQIYGSTKVGAVETNINMQQQTIATNYFRKQKKYYLSNYKQDVAVVISDAPIQKTTNNTTIAWYEADVLSANYFTSYGAISKLVGTTPTIGFNAQKRSGEIGANAQTAMFWEYNGDIGRRANIDPVTKPWESPYVSFGDNPILMSDPLGNDADSDGGKKKKAITTAKTNMPEVIVKAKTKNKLPKPPIIKPSSESTCGGCEETKRAALDKLPQSPEQIRKEITASILRKPQATISEAKPQGPANEFEAGARTGVLMVPGALAAEYCPTCLVVVGTHGIYQGIKQDDNEKIFFGVLNTVGGGLGIYKNGFMPTRPIISTPNSVLIQTNVALNTIAADMPLSAPMTAEVLSEGGCDMLARQVQSVIGGEFLNIENPLNQGAGPIRAFSLGPVTASNGTIGSWYNHVAVLKNGMVFDGLTGVNGMPLESYKLLFHYHDALTFTPSKIITIK